MFACRKKKRRVEELMKYRNFVFKLLKCVARHILSEIHLGTGLGAINYTTKRHESCFAGCVT